MKKHIHFIFAMLIAVCSLAAQSVQAQGSEKEQRIKASYLIAFGRMPSSGELNHWNQQANMSVQQLVDNHKNYLTRDAGTKRAVIVKSYNDAMGRNPSSGELAHWSKYSQSYTDLMKAHVNWLASNRGEYGEVVKRSYQKVFGRQPNSGELNFWVTKPYSYMVLLACHEEYKRTNGSSASGSTTKISSSPSALVTVSVSPTVANEARAAAGLIGAGGGNLIAAGGGNIIAPGGGNLIGAGGGNLINPGNRQ